VRGETSNFVLVSADHAPTNRLRSLAKTSTRAGRARLGDSDESERAD
jgi:hypothetical protein